MTRTRTFRRAIVMGTAVLLWAGAVPAAAQSPPSYFFPDVPASALIHDGESIWIKPIFAVVGDYTAFKQDDASVEQVDQQESTGELRAGRLGVSIRSKARLKWEFYTTVDYLEPRTRDHTVFDLYDLRVGVGIRSMRINVGKQKEPFSYELGALSVILPQQERILLPFFPTRNIGVNLSGELAGGRMTWAAGAFNDWLSTGVDFKQNATDYVGRVSALAWESPDKTRYVHLGLGFRDAGADDGIMRFAGRPESNVADKFVDTGEFAAHDAQIWSLEALGSLGRFSVLTESIHALSTPGTMAIPPSPGTTWEGRGS